ncbi:BRO family protein [Streptomyces griseus]|uniref:BRO-N domain-containing protein n=1 Tax=Streptomyces griseus TaxID=1911 RepID=UPI00068A92FB|nr:BRO family protein [Streptomyces griseus]
MKPFNDRAALQLFNVSGMDIRFGITEDNRPYAVAADYAKALGYRDAEKATRLLDEEEKGTQIVGTSESSGRITQRPVSVIYEDGLWELIFRSTLPGAKAIKKQVKQILKEIRETGQYVAVAPPLMGGGTVPWEHAAAVARSHGLKVDAHGFKALLISGGVLTTRNGAPRRKWEYLFWPVPDSPRWEVRTVVLPQLVYFAAQVRRELALAERALQMSLPFPVAGPTRDELGGAS